VPHGQLPPGIIRFTHHLQAITFSLVYRVAACTGGPAAQWVENLCATILLIQHSAAKVTCNVAVANM